MGTDNNTNLGINRENLSFTITELKNNVEVVKESLTNIEDLIDKSNSCINGDVGVAFRSKAAKFTFVIPTIESNLETYVEDLTNFLNNYINFESGYAVDND